MKRFKLSKYKFVNIFLWFSILYLPIPFLYFCNFFYLSKNMSWTRTYSAFAMLYLLIFLYFLVATIFILGIIIEIIIVKYKKKSLIENTLIPKYFRYPLIFLALLVCPVLAYFYYFAVNLCEYIFGKW